MLGGSSSHNFLDVVRGSPHDFDHWRDLGNEGWGFDQVLRYFKKSENNRNPKYSETGELFRNRHMGSLYYN